MTNSRRLLRDLRSRFDEIYDSKIVGGGFFETDEYYINEKERYWRSLEFLVRLDIPLPARILEIGGGQISVLCKSLFGDDCVVADISQDFAAPLRNAGIQLVTFNLMDPDVGQFTKTFDVVVLLEVIEHIPRPAYLVIEGLKPLLNENGLLFLTTPNLFRIRNLIRMIRGKEFLDHFMIAQPGVGLGHQLEYSASHLKWQLEYAGMDIVMLEHDSMGRTGHSRSSRLARQLLAPLDLRPVWRNGLVAAASNKSAVSPTVGNGATSAS